MKFNFLNILRHIAIISMSVAIILGVIFFIGGINKVGLIIILVWTGVCIITAFFLYRGTQGITCVFEEEGRFIIKEFNDRYVITDSWVYAGLTATIYKSDIYNRRILIYQEGSILWVEQDTFSRTYKNSYIIPDNSDDYEEY